MSVPVFVRLLRLSRRSVFRVLPVRCPVSAALPSGVLSVLSRAGAGAVGFSGSRSSVPAVVGAVAARVASLRCPVFVGCAAGVDAAFRGFFPGASVLAASSFGSGRGSFAARSVAVVRAVAVAGGVWVSFPSSACPFGLLPSASPSRAFCGSGSGSWASAAFAVGAGLPVLVFGFAPPAGWGFSSLGGGWWFSGWPASQLSLGF